MDKKDIYEHLAKIYLDASLKKKNKTKNRSRIFKNIFFLNIALIIGLSVFLFINLKRNKALNTETALILQPDAVKINFHFDPAKKEIYSLNLNKLNLSKFKALGFSAKTSHYNDKLSLRVEFTSAFKENSEVYIKDINSKWRDYKINFLEFKNISNWSEVLRLAFIVEEWNAREKRSVVYIDNVRLLR